MARAMLSAMLLVAASVGAACSGMRPSSGYPISCECKSATRYYGKVRNPNPSAGCPPCPDGSPAR